MQNNEVLKEETIMGLPISEVRRQCSSNREFADKSDLGPINRNANPLDICIEGGNEIINNPELLTFFRSLYTGEGNVKNQNLTLKKTKKINKN